jgi:hypothetical protein
MLAGPLTSASSFIRPWQVGQARTSTAKVRARSSAHGHGGFTDEQELKAFEIVRAFLVEGG